MGIRYSFFKLGHRLKRSSPTILCFLAAAGVVATAVSAVKATPKAKQNLGIAEMNKGEKLNEVEMVLAMAPAYIPSALIGLGTVVCIFGSNALSRKQQASLTSAYVLLENYHKRYRNTLINLYGEEADEEVRTAMAREYCDYHQLHLDAPDGKVIFFEEISGQTICCYEREIMDAEYHFNRNFVLQGCACLNDFLEMAGMNTMDYGDDLGWTCADGEMWVDFEHKLIPSDDGGPDMYLISFVFSPREGYLDV